MVGDLDPRLRELLLREPLSAVNFVHDYIQLVFQDTGVNAYTAIELTTPDKALRSGDLGFCDALVSLVGASPTDVTSSPESLTIVFGSTRVSTPRSSGAPSS